MASSEVAASRTWAPRRRSSMRILRPGPGLASANRITRGAVFILHLQLPTRVRRKSGAIPDSRALVQVRPVLLGHVRGQLEGAVRAGVVGLMHLGHLPASVLAQIFLDQAVQAPQLAAPAGQ